MIKKYSEEKRLEVINARKDEASIAQITAQTGVGQTTIKIWLKDAGLTVNRKWKSDEIQTILKDYNCKIKLCVHIANCTICPRMLLNAVSIFDGDQKPGSIF